MNKTLAGGTLVALGVALSFPGAARGQPVVSNPPLQGQVINLAGSNATCLKDPSQLPALEQERALLSRSVHRQLAIIAMPQDDGIRLGQQNVALGCRVCGPSSNEVLVCFADASAVGGGGSAPAGSPPQPSYEYKGGQSSQSNWRGAAPGNPIAAPLSPGGGSRFEGEASAKPQAEALARDGRWQELRNLAGQWRASNPNSAQAWFYTGWAAENLRDTRMAQSYYGQAVSLDPRLDAAQYGLGRTLLATHSYQQAVAPLQNAVRAYPSEARAWTDLGIALDHCRRPQEALPALQRAVSLAPDDPLVAGPAAEAYMLNRQWSNATPLLERAIRKQPFDSDNLNWMDELGAAYNLMGDYHHSSQVFEATLNIDSSDPNTWYYLWQDYSKLGDSAKAEQAHQKMVQLTTPQRPLYASHDPMGAIIRAQNEAYAHNTGQLNPNEHLP